MPTTPMGDEDFIRHAQYNENPIVERSFSQLILDTNIARRIKFEKCTFEQVVIKCNLEKGVEFHDCDFNQGVQIEKGDINDLFTLSNCSGKNLSAFGKLNCFVNIIDCNFINVKINVVSLPQAFKVINFCQTGNIGNTFSLNVKNIIAGHFLLEKIKCNDISLILPKHELLGFSATNINTTNFRVVNVIGRSALFSDIHCNIFEIDNVRNHGSIKFHNIKAKGHLSKFKMTNAELGKTSFDHIDFRVFKQIEISDSQFMQIIISNMKWNFSYDSYSGEFMSKRELFRQLKIVSSNHKDKYSELNFERMENNALGKMISPKHFVDWFIFKTNQLSNNFGQNWLLPLAWLFATSFIFYYFLVEANGLFGSCFHIGNYLNFVMPFHSLDNVLCNSSANQFNGATLFWDTIQRIFSSYFIFQMLTAFRKYVR